MIMDILKKITENTLVITTSVLKKHFLLSLSENQRLLSVKFMTLEEFLERYFFKVKKEAYLYLKEREKKKVSILEEEVSYFPFLHSSSYSSSKLTHLKKLVEELEENHLLERDLLFLSYLETCKIVVYGYDLAPFYQNLFENILHAEVFRPATFDSRPLTVYRFHDIEEEIGFVGGEILCKLHQGVPLKKIKLFSLPDEYKNPIRRIFSFLHIPIEIGDDPKLFETMVGQYTLDCIKEADSLDQVCTLVLEKFPNEVAVESVISILNEYLWYSGKPSQLLEFIVHDFQKQSISMPQLKNKIECVTEVLVDEDVHYFLLGFNKENIPKVYKDESYLTDQELQELGLFTSAEKNQLEKEKWKNLLYHIPYMTITYKEKSAFDHWNKSLLIEEMDFSEKEGYSSYQDSHIYNQVLLARFLDRLNKYGIIEKDLSILYSTYSSIPYMMFQNQFSGIDPEELKTFMKNKLLLSYSSIDNFYRCSFRYYLTNILKIDPFQRTFFTDIGTIFHNVLEHITDQDFDFDSYFETEILKYDFKVGERVLLEQLKEELFFDIQVLNKQRQYTLFCKEFHERKFYLPVSKKDELETTFMGVIDKILMLRENERDYLAIVDYKTGYLPDSLNRIVYGIGMQLPIYLYLVKRSQVFDSPKVVGLFLQKIINKEMRRQGKKEYLEERTNNLKLVGYVLDDEELLDKFDETYEDSKMIHSLKKGKNGFYKYSRVLSEEKFSQLENIVDTKILEADQEIRKGNFLINPKRIGKDLVGCEFCKYHDICFRKEENIISLKEYKNLDFLGGDIDV